MTTRRSFLQSSAALATVAVTGIRSANAAPAPGVTDTEIKIGQTMAYSGPASAYGVIGRVDAAYFKYINENGGVNGRKLNLISLDDGYSPPKTVEQTRALVEEEKVAFLFNSLGTPTNAAVRSYLNENKVPQLFVASGANMFADPEHFPWTMGFQPNYQVEAQIYGKHILKTKPNAKIGLLYQNDAFGKDYLVGLKTALGSEHAGMLVKEISYEVTEPTIDSQIIVLQGAGIDTLVIAATPKFASQAIRKAFDIGLNADRFVSVVSASVTSVMKPAGLEKAKGVMTAYFGKDPSDPLWKDDAGMKEWAAFAAKYLKPNDFRDSNAVYAFSAAATMVQALKQCGNDLSRENIMKQAENIKGLTLPLLLPGMTVNTSPNNFNPVRQMKLASFDGQSWQLFGELMGG